MKAKGIPVICVLSIVAVALVADGPKSVAEVKKALARQGPLRNPRGPGAQPAATAEPTATAAAGDGARFSKLKDLQGEGKQGWPITDVVFSADGKTLAGANHFKVRLWEVDSGKRLGDFLGKNGEQIMAVRFLPGGKHLVSASNRAVRVWDWAKGAEIRTLPGCHTVELSRDGKRLLAATENGCGLWRTDDWKLVRAFKLPAHRALALSPDGSMIAVGERMLPKIYPPNYRAAVTVRAAETGKELARFPGFAARVVFSPEGKRLAVVRGGVTLWSLAGRKLLRTFKAGRLGCGSAAFSPDGRLIAAGGGSDPATGASRGALAVWDVATGRLLATLGVREGKKGSEWVTGVAFSADGKCLAACDSQGAVRIWQVPAAAPRPHAKGGRLKALPAPEPLDLDKAAKMLTKAAGGTWRTLTTNDVGVTLHGTMSLGGRFHALCVVFPFRYDEVGKAKVLSYAEGCTRPFRVLGSTEQRTVLADQYAPNPPAKDAVPALSRLEYDTVASVRAAAIEAIRKIQGDGLPPLSLTAEATLPGSWLPATGAVRDGYDFVAVYEAAGPADVINETGRLGLATQWFATRKVLAARTHVISNIQLNYLYPRYSPRRWVSNDGDLVHSGAVGKGRRLIWVIREIPTAGALTRQRRQRAWLGVKAMPDTPENRVAVVQAIQAVGSAKRLRANVKNFRMTLTYHGPKPRDCIHLTLTAAPRPPKITPPLPYGMLLRHIDEKQATRIIDHLVKSGFFARADCVSPYRRTILKTPRGPAYVLTVTGGAGWLFQGDLGWGVKMLLRLDALRKVLDGEAAKAMDKLLDKLAPQREKWEKEAVATQPAPTAKPMRFKTVKEAVAFITECVEKNNPKRLSNAASGHRPRAQSAFSALVKLHAATPLSELYAGKTFPKDKAGFKLGGHGKKWRHVHIDFVRKEDGWALADIWGCK